jgi:predicted N-acyltransferase
LVEAVVEVAQAEGCQTLGFFYIKDRRDAQVVAEVLGGGEPFLSDISTDLAGEWPDFESYLDSLPSGSRTKRRRERRRFLESGLEMEVVEGTSRLDERTAGLQLQLREKYGVGGSTRQILADYDALRDTVDADVRVFLCSRDGIPIGLSLALLDGDRMHVRLSGFDYSAVGRDFVYFNTTFYEPITWGIEHGIRSFVFGTGTYRAKVERGCRLVPTYAAVRWPQEIRDEARLALAERTARLSAEAGLAPGDGRHD